MKERLLQTVSNFFTTATQPGEAHWLVMMSQGARGSPASGQASCSLKAGPGQPRAGTDPGQGDRLWPRHVLDTELPGAG